MGYGTLGGKLNLGVDALWPRSAGASAPDTGTPTGWSRNNLRANRISGTDPRDGGAGNNRAWSQVPPVRR